jgi:ribose 1,5-bisphosphokinase
MNARLIYVVGPSGAGKDSLLNWLRKQLPATSQVHWVRRTITRAPDGGGENHESVNLDEFKKILAHQGFAMHWRANDLHYGIRHEELVPLNRMQWVFVNGSRANLEKASEQYPGMVILHITASAEVLKQRLLNRGRESHDTIEARMRRTVEVQWPSDCRLIEITNNGSLETSGLSLLTKLKQLPNWSI